MTLLNGCCLSPEQEVHSSNRLASHRHSGLLHIPDIVAEHDNAPTPPLQPPASAFLSVQHEQQELAAAQQQAVHQQQREQLLQQQAAEVATAAAAAQPSAVAPPQVQQASLHSVGSAQDFGNGAGSVHTVASQQHLGQQPAMAAAMQTIATQQQLAHAASLHSRGSVQDFGVAAAPQQLAGAVSMRSLGSVQEFGAEATAAQLSGPVSMQSLGSQQGFGVAGLRPAPSQQQLVHQQSAPDLQSLSSLHHQAQSLPMDHSGQQPQGMQVTHRLCHLTLSCRLEATCLEVHNHNGCTPSNHISWPLCTGRKPAGACQSAAAAGHAGPAQWQRRPAICPWRRAVPCDADSTGATGCIAELQHRAGRPAVADRGAARLLGRHGAPRAAPAAQLSGVRTFCRSTHERAGAPYTCQNCCICVHI